jgi:hypothetical protein
MVEVGSAMKEKDPVSETATEAEASATESATAEVKEREVDLNALFPGREYDLNRLFPDEGTKKLLHDLKRNKRDIERFIKNMEEEGD